MHCRRVSVEALDGGFVVGKALVTTDESRDKSDEASSLAASESNNHSEGHWLVASAYLLTTLLHFISQEAVPIEFVKLFIFVAEHRIRGRLSLIYVKLGATRAAKPADDWESAPKASIIVRNLIL